MRKGFTLIEMLVVMGIIAILTGASVAGYSSMVRRAELTRTRELVSNVATAMGALYVREGVWPKKLVAAASSDHLLDQDAGLSLAKKGFLSLDMDKDKTKLVGYDRYGVVTPWGVDLIKRSGGSLSGKNEELVKKHILRFAIDDDGDGFTDLPADVADGNGSKVRAMACVWCCDRTGSLEKKKIVKSWTDGQCAK